MPGVGPTRRPAHDPCLAQARRCTRPTPWPVTEGAAIYVAVSLSPDSSWFVLRFATNYPRHSSPAQYLHSQQKRPDTLYPAPIPTTFSRDPHSHANANTSNYDLSPVVCCTTTKRTPGATRHAQCGCLLGQLVAASRHAHVHPSDIRLAMKEVAHRRYIAHRIVELNTLSAER
ncbi:hypothetical protein OG21DRAFT_1491792 [Imleria badia]|nr:hypothetical protein OG21DRAFT_1491792 [Imleria badia]